MTRSMNSSNKIALVIGLVTVLSACSESGGRQDENSMSEPETTAPDQIVAAPEPQQEEVRTGMNTKQQIAYATEDLSKRLDIDPDTVNLSGAKTVRWRSGAMGCPKPGMMYTQALVPGVSIVLLVDGSEFHYHATTSGQPFFCPEEQVESPVKGSGAD